MPHRQMALIALLLGCAPSGPPPPVVPAGVRSYQAPRASRAPTIDGRLDDSVWAGSSWSEAFVDIEGATRPQPPLATRFKLAWDASHLYVAVQLEEPDLWATLTQRDAVIYHDNDIELFIDPDGDGLRYFELELNALNTPWDLFLAKPYRDGGHGDNSWDIAGLRSAVWLDGTLNDSRDRDRGWSVEIAIPWQAFSDSGRTRLPPRRGDRWRINFSRVEWDLDPMVDGYRKRPGAPEVKHPEHNWVWSPQGEINMHAPERWGVVEFVDLSRRSATRP
ncbi:MAG: carbohydrate-binding family 9-like protein [Gemmatimonadota bacterium]